MRLDASKVQLPSLGESIRAWTMGLFYLVCRSADRWWGPRAHLFCSPELEVLNLLLSGSEAPGHSADPS